MAHVERRDRKAADGTMMRAYRVRWREPDGRERNKTFQRKVEADRFCAVISADLVKGQYVDPDAGKQDPLRDLRQEVDRRTDLR